MRRTRWFSFCSVLLTVVMVVLGFLLNARFPVLRNGGTLSAEGLHRGIALTDWVEVAPQEWEFSFTPVPDAGELVLCLASRTAPGASAVLTAADSSGELYQLDTVSDEPVTLTVHAERLPRAWLLPTEHASRWMETRTLLQLMALTAFVTIALVTLALFYYKHQRELGCFLLYLVIISGWGILVYLVPVGYSAGIQFLLRLLFSLAVLAPLWLCQELTGVRLVPPRASIVMTAAFLLLSCIPLPWVRVPVLVLGMFWCMAVLVRAVEQGQRPALLLLIPCAVTTGFRVWVLLPSLELPLFIESIPFYVFRCARIYDLPFALGCMTFVCRQFALQFDRTEQLARELDARVIEHTRALTEETEARKSMMLNIFHDLRSPLFAVSSGLDTLENAPEALPALLPVLQQRVEFLRHLTEDLFLAAKLEQKQVMLNEDRVALNEAAAAVCESCRSEAEKKGVLLSADTTASLPVWGDSTRLQQIIQNLLTNAIHYTPAGGNITVTCKAEGGSALVSVQDTGCGIAPEDQAAVFDRYFHTTTNSKHDSTGLGLTIAQELARMHHGEILLESEVGKGSCFTLKLPLLSV